MAGHGTVSPRRGSLGGLAGAPVWRDRALLQPHAGLGGDGTVETDGREVHGETQRSAAQRRDGGWRPRRSDFLMFKRILGCVLFGLFLVKDVRR